MDNVLCPDNTTEINQTNGETFKNLFPNFEYYIYFAQNLNNTLNLPQNLNFTNSTLRLFSLNSNKNISILSTFINSSLNLENCNVELNCKQNSTINSLTLNNSKFYSFKNVKIINEINLTNCRDVSDISILQDNATLNIFDEINQIYFTNSSIKIYQSDITHNYREINIFSSSMSMDIIGSFSNNDTLSFIPTIYFESMSIIDFHGWNDLKSDRKIKIISPKIYTNLTYPSHIFDLKNPILINILQMSLYLYENNISNFEKVPKNAVPIEKTDLCPSIMSNRLQMILNIDCNVFDFNLSKYIGKTVRFNGIKRAKVNIYGEVDSFIMDFVNCDATIYNSTNITILTLLNDTALTVLKPIHIDLLYCTYGQINSNSMISSDNILYSLTTQNVKLDQIPFYGKEQTSLLLFASKITLSFSIAPPPTKSVSVFLMKDCSVTFDESVYSSNKAKSYSIVADESISAEFILDSSVPGFADFPNESDRIFYRYRPTPSEVQKPTGGPILIENDPYLIRTIEIVGSFIFCIVFIALLGCWLFNGRSGEHNDVDVLLIMNKDMEEDTNDSVKQDLRL